MLARPPASGASERVAKASDTDGSQAQPGRGSAEQPPTRRVGRDRRQRCGGRQPARPPRRHQRRDDDDQLDDHECHEQAS